MKTVTYYQGHTVLVTHDVFETRVPNRQRYHVADLYDVYVTRGGADLSASRVFGATGALFVVALATWPLLHTDALWLAAVLLVAAPGAVAGFAYRRSHSRWELRATYRGDQVELYSTNDLRTFGQVKRALVRALEANVTQTRPLAGLRNHGHLK